MRIDVHALESYNELAREGAEAAARALSDLADLETRVEVTDVSLQSSSDVTATVDTCDLVGVTVPFGPPLAGETVLAFDERAREAIASELVPEGDPEATESAIVEVGNILANGFVSGWADHLGAKIESEPPSYVDGAGADVFPSAADDERVLVFRSRITTVADDLEFTLLLVPDAASMGRLLERRDRGGIAVEKLEVFTEMTERGTARAADDLTTMTGIDVAVRVNRLRFTPLPDIPGQIGDDRRIGTVVEFSGSPSGYLAVLFDPTSARQSVRAVLPGALSDGDRWTETEREALEELCNVAVSGFVDGWANVLRTSITHSPPRFVADMGSSLVSPVIADVAREGNYAFVLDSTIEAAAAEDVRCQLLALPRPDELEAALEDLLVERAAETTADPDQLF